jgi:hypothetical protein
MPTKRHVTAGTKKLVAGRQRYMCAANVSEYACPLRGTPFDEAGYEVDHIVPLSEGGSNDASNLQALCLMCHRVKSNRASAGKPKKACAQKKKKATQGFVYNGPTMSDCESDWSTEDEPDYYWPDDAGKKPLKIKWKVGSDSLKFGLWRTQFGYSQFPDVNGYYSRQR